VTLNTSNFAGRLVERIGQASSLIDATTGRTISGEDLPRLIAMNAGTLVSAGLKKGDRVLIGCSLSPASVLVYLGAMYAGLVAVPVEDRTLSASLSSLLDATGAKAVWTETGIKEEPNGRSVIYLQGDIADVAQSTTTPATCLESDLAALMATSGSTGTPRFVMVTHGNLIANTEAIIRSQHLTDGERAMLILPLSYCFGASVMHTHLYQGGSVVFDRRFMFPDKVLNAIAEFGCTTFAGVPTAYNVLLRRSKIRQTPMPTLKRFLQAGGGLSRERVEEMRALFPTAKFYVMYGQTEATARIACMDPDRWEEKRGSVGRPLDNLTIRIVDENGNDVATGEVGELLVSGPSICSGYLNEAGDAKVFCDGWLRTRDFAHQDKEGFLWIDGRKGNFLKMRGIRISFAEVTSKVTAIPGIFECAARAVDHPEAGEALVLFIVPDQGVKLEAEDVRRQLPAHWALDSIRLVPELPKTYTGKLALQSLTVQATDLDAAIRRKN
jgi:acyl-CoA synthetase (AMP-forming)/AMP-acid ligase II